MYGDFLGSYENHRFLNQTGEASFWATFGKTWATFYSNILSHCTLSVFISFVLCCLYVSIFAFFHFKHQIWPQKNGEAILYRDDVIGRQRRLCVNYFFLKVVQTSLFLFFLLLKHKFYCGLQRFSNWDRHSTRQDGWPLDHHLGPNTLIFVSTSIRHFSPESFYASNDGKWPINQRSFHARVGHSVIRVPALWNILL